MLTGRLFLCWLGDYRNLDVELSKFMFLTSLLFVVAIANYVDREMWISSICINVRWLNVCLCFQSEPSFNWFGSKKMKIIKNSKHFWFFCCIVTEDEIITCKSDFVSSLCVYYLRAALEVLLIIFVQLDSGKECSL